MINLEEEKKEAKDQEKDPVIETVHIWASHDAEDEAAPKSFSSLTLDRKSPSTAGPVFPRSLPCPLSKGWLSVMHYRWLCCKNIPAPQMGQALADAVV